MITTYKAYDKGFLPAKGGLDDQPALFLPTMQVISSAINAEQELEREKSKKRQSMIERSQAQAKSSAGGKGNPGMARIPTKGKRKG